MSYKFDAPDPQSGPDVDFDFFDDPQPQDLEDRKSPTNLGNYGKWNRTQEINHDNTGTSKDLNELRSKSSKTKKSQDTNNSKPPTTLNHDHGKKKSHDHRKVDDDDSYSSDYTDEELDTSTDTSGNCKDVRKIEAKIPTADDTDRKKTTGKKRDHSSEKKSTKTSHNNRNAHTQSYSSDSANTNSALSESDYSTDTDSDVTDVSPLHTPHSPSSAAVSRRSQDTQRSALRSGKPPKSPGHKEVTFRRPPSAGSSQSSHRGPLTRADSDNIDFKLLMQAVIEMEGRSGDLAHAHSQSQLSNYPHMPGTQVPKNRKNMSFSNDSVRTIDRENQRLMQNIMSQSRLAKQKKQAIRNTGTAKVPTTNKVMTTSAINRNNEQKRIERENLAMLQRLQNAKPVKTLAKEKLIEEYEHQVLFGYSVAAAHPLPKKKTVANRAPSPYIVPFDPKLKSRSMTNLANGSSDISGFSAPSSTRIARPASATTRSARPQSATPHKKRPQSAKVSGSSTQISSGPPERRPAWDERW